MIQDPRPGDLIAEVPGRGPLVRELPTLRALFADLLAQGSVVEHGGARRIAWRVDGMSPLRSSDPRVRAAADRLGVSVTAARACSERFAALLRERPGASEINLPGELLKELSGADRGEVRLQRRQVEFLRDLTRQAAEAVDEAIGRGDFVGDPQHVLLIGWGFLPPPERRGLHRKPIEAALELRDAGAAPLAPSASWSLGWTVSGPATAVELFSVDPAGGGPSPVPGTRRVLVETPAAGEWTLPCDAVTPGTVVHAVAAGASGVARSSPVRLGTAVVAEPVHIPEEPDSDSFEPPMVELPPARGIPRRLVLAAVSVLLLLATFIGTYVVIQLNPPTPTFASAEMLFVSPALPPTPRPPDARGAWGLGEPGESSPRGTPPEPFRSGREPEGLGGAAVPVPERAGAASPVPAIVAGRRIPEFEVGRADRVASVPLPVAPPRAIPEFRVGVPDFVAFDDLRRHAGDPDAVLELPDQERELAKSADEGLRVLLGIGMKRVSKEVLDWARDSGLRVEEVDGGADVLLLATSSRPFRGQRSEVTDGALKLNWGNSRIQAWGIDVWPVVAIESNAGGVACAGTLDGSPGVTLGVRQVIPLKASTLVAWRLEVRGAERVDVSFKARECNVETHRFRFSPSKRPGDAP